MTFMDMVMGWLSGIAPIPLILVLFGFGKLVHFLTKNLRSNRPNRFDDHDFR